MFCECATLRYSLHLSTMYGHNHAFFDPNIWHLDEELRKQVETFAKCFIMTGQEAPETSKKLHVDLYKKTISADGIMGRKPYGYSTRMFHTVGWTRLEVNRIMQFVGVKNKSFFSMFRRSMVWKARARFIHKKFLVNYPDHEQDGIFEADPSLNKFLETSQASIAGLKLQWAFEAEHNLEECYQIIEDYCNGGDGYLTEDVMRSACGLPVRQRNLQADEGVGNLINADVESDAEKDDKTKCWHTLRESMVTYLLSKDTESITYYEFKKMPLQADTHPNVSRSVMWDELENHHVVRKSLAEGKTSKEKPGRFFPMLQFGKDFTTECLSSRSDTIRLQFEEERDIGLVRRYAYRCRGRAMNDENLRTFYASMIPEQQRKGRKSLETLELTQKYQKLLQKAQDHEARLSAVLASTKRRVTEKSSADEGRPADLLSQERDPATLWPSSLVAKSVHYHYSKKPKYSILARRYSSQEGTQAMSKRLQKHAVDVHTLDFDIQNCAVTLLFQIIEKIKPKPALPEELSKVLERLATERAAFLSELGVDSVRGKKIVNAVLNGGSPPENLKANGNIQKLQKISIYLRWVAMNLLYDDYTSLKDVKDKPFPSATVLSLLWQSVEDVVLCAWTEQLVDMKPKHLSLHFDGVRVSKNAIANAESHIAACEKAITEKTSFRVKIVLKAHRTFRELVQEHGTPCNLARLAPERLLVPGNCIYCSLWHCVQSARVPIVTAAQNSGQSENRDALKLGYRTYRSASKSAGVDLVCSPGLPPEEVKSFLLHYEGDGHPHCVCVKHDATGNCTTIMDGASAFRMTITQFQEVVASAVDESSIVSFWIPDESTTENSKAKILLDMVAGASSSSSDHGAEAAPVKVAGKLVFDEEHDPTIDDGIKTLLAEEVAEISANLQSRSIRRDGRRLCPMCPFRSFKHMRGLRIHIQKHHTEKTQFICSGTKQMKIVLALFDDAASSQKQPARLLQQSASLLQKTVQPEVSNSMNRIDKHIRLVLDCSGPRYVNVDCIGNDLCVRRVRNLYYTHSFADMILREAVLNHAQVPWFVFIM